MKIRIQFSLFFAIVLLNSAVGDEPVANNSAYCPLFNNLQFKSATLNFSENSQYKTLLKINTDFKNSFSNIDYNTKSPQAIDNTGFFKNKPLVSNVSNAPFSNYFQKTFWAEFGMATLGSGLGMLAFGAIGGFATIGKYNECEERNLRREDDDSPPLIGCDDIRFVGIAIGAGVGYGVGPPLGLALYKMVSKRKGSILYSSLVNIVCTASMLYTTIKLYEVYGDNTRRVTVPILVITPQLSAILGYEIKNLF